MRSLQSLFDERHRIPLKKIFDYRRLALTMQIWLLIIYLLFPIPLVSLILLSIPLPKGLKFIRTYILALLDRIIFFHLNKYIAVYHVSLGLSLILFLTSISDTLKNHHSKGTFSNVLGLSEQKCFRHIKIIFWVKKLKKRYSIL